MQETEDERKMMQEPWPVMATDDDDENENDKLPKERPSPIELDLLKKERTLIISEDVTPKLTRRVTASLLWLDGRSSDPVKLYINTPGGSADDGFALHDMVRFIKAPVYTVSVGLNASAGILLLLAAPKERRLALPNSRLMMHQPSGGGRGSASDINITAEEILKIRGRTNELIARETGKPLEEVAKDTDRDFWLSAEEAKEYGLVSRVVPSLRDIF